MVSTDPEAIVAFIVAHADTDNVLGMESGAMSTWLWTELNKIGQPIICIDARHAKAVLKMQINKSDRNDAVGCANPTLTLVATSLRLADHLEMQVTRLQAAPLVA